MSTRLRFILAVVAALCVLAPMAQGPLLALLVDHAHGQAQLASSLEATLHGHHHEAGTPAHSHAFVVPAPILKVGLTEAPPLPPTSLSAGTAAAPSPICSPPSTVHLEGTGGLPPLPAASLPSILRI